LIKKIIIGVLCFILGMVIGFYLESSFRVIIQDIFKWTTSNKIQFIGKNFSFFSDKSFEYFLGFGLMLFVLINLKSKPIQVFKNLIICLFIFIISIFIISAIDANIKIVECTACDNGINYSLIISTSIIISIIPCLIQIIKQLKAKY